MINCSVCILTYNSERTLEKCLESVRDFKEILILDGGSTDKTLEIAKKYDARILPQVEGKSGKIDDFTKIRQKSFDLSKEEWVFWIDSDEYLSQGAQDKIRKIVNEEGNKKCIYTLNRKAIINDRSIEYAYYYPQRIKRLWNKESGTRLKKDKKVHEDLFVGEGITVKNLNEDLYHYWNEEYKDLIQKDNYYLGLALRGDGKAPFGKRIKKAIINILKGLNVILKSSKIYLRHGFKKSMPPKYIWRYIRYHLILAKKQL